MEVKGVLILHDPTRGVEHSGGRKERARDDGGFRRVAPGEVTDPGRGCGFVISDLAFRISRVLVGSLICLPLPMPLDDLRKKIDALDSELLRLLNERAEVVHGIGEKKKEKGLMIYAPEREESLLKALVKKNEEFHGRLPGRWCSIEPEQGVKPRERECQAVTRRQPC